MTRVLVTGVAGQIGSFVAELLLSRGCSVLGSVLPEETIPKGVSRLETPLDAGSVNRLFDEAGSLDAIIHLAAQSSVASSWSSPLANFDANARLTAALAYGLAEKTSVHFLHMSSAEIFGSARERVQTEETPIAPTNPYGVAKAAAHMAVRLAREGMRVPASNVIGYLAESERRPARFVFRKITRGLAEVSLGMRPRLALGNTSVIRDFSHARDVASAIVLVALDAPPGDYICASGEGHAISDIVDVACAHLGLDPKVAVETDPSLLRPVDIPSLIGNSAKLRALGWKPSMDFERLVESVVDFDVRDLRETRGK